MPKRKTKYIAPVPAKKYRPTPKSDDKISQKIIKLCENDDFNYKCRKVPLNKILLTQHRAAITKYITECSIKLTKLSRLASLWFLKRVNNAVEQKDQKFFKEDEVKFVVRNCFQAVIGAFAGKKKRTKCDEDFEHALNENNVTKPDTKNLGNAFNYLIEQYLTCLENANALSFARQRFRKYFRTIENTDRKKMEDTITFILHEKSRVLCDEKLMGSLKNIGLDKENEHVRGFFASRNWCENMPVYINMQREIENYNNRNKTSENNRPVKTFSVVPIFGCRRQHVRIDKDVFYRICNQLGVLSEKKHGKKKTKKPITQKQFNDAKNTENELGKILDLKKIKQMGGKKNDFFFKFAPMAYQHP